MKITNVTKGLLLLFGSFVGVMVAAFLGLWGGLQEGAFHWFGLGAGWMLGLMSVIAFLVAIYLIMKGGPYRPNEEFIERARGQEPAYAGLSDEQVAYMRGWSWGAFFGTPIWAFGSRLYGWGILSLLPYISIVAVFDLAINGRRDAWKKGWESYDAFRARQRLMGSIILALNLIGIALVIVAILLTPHGP